MSQGKTNGTLSSCKTDARVRCRVIQRKAQERSCLRRFLPSFQEPGKFHTDNSKGFIKVCQDREWTHVKNAPHRSNANKITDRAVPRVTEGTPTGRVQSGRSEQWWDRAMECFSFLRNVRGKMADRKTASHKKCGVTFDRLLIPNGASYKPTHLLQRRVATALAGLRCAFRSLHGLRLTCGRRMV